MANRYYTFVEREYYHIYNRGNNKQVIFRGPSDYSHFNKLLYLSNGTTPFLMREIENNDDIFLRERGEQQVHIGAYCLMPNHFHILVTPAREGGVSKFMLKLGTGISSYINKKYQRTGSLFEGQYKAKHVGDDRYLKYLFAYIHLNPFWSDAEAHPHSIYTKEKFLSYSYSSLPDYLGTERQEAKILSKEKFPLYFERVEKNAKELREWLDYSQ